MESDASDHHSTPFNTSQSSTRQMSPPQTPTDLHRKSSLHEAFDYSASRVIMNESEEDYTTEDDILPDPAPSGRSSISSFPASIVHHDIRPSQTFPYDIPHTPSRSRNGTPSLFRAHSQQHIKSQSPTTTRHRISGFRNPSSVRALQMRDEFSDEEYTPGHQRRDSRTSYVSYRSGSAHSTPGKRMSRSLQSSPVKNTSKLRKEFPLVLLHCTLIPSMISPKIKTVSEELLEAIIPEPYKKRWKLLQEKILKNFEVRERGVLIPHPREDYDLLEERLLESLELEAPVVDHGHFVGRSESRASATDSGLGSEENSLRGDATDEDDDQHRCIDCGGHICGEKRWEVKVYAANGLMKSGAWAAAWSEMEKIDVQVSVWLPEEIGREIEARLDAVIAQEQLLQAEELSGKEEVANDERTKEIYGESPEQKKPEDIDGFGDGHEPSSQSPPSARPSIQRKSSQVSATAEHNQVNLQTALLNYVCLIMRDSKNVAILMLCMLLVFYGTNRQQVPSTNELLKQPILHPMHETQVEILTSTVTTTSVSIAVETSTVTETAKIMASLPPGPSITSSPDQSEQNREIELPLPSTDQDTELDRDTDETSSSRTVTMSLEEITTESAIDALPINYDEYSTDALPAQSQTTKDTIFNVSEVFFETPDAPKCNWTITPEVEIDLEMGHEL